MSKQCPKCNEWKIETLSSHEWVRANLAEVEHHRHIKCVNCCFEQNECQEQRKKIILAAIYGIGKKDLIEETQYDMLEKDTEVQTARIYHYFEEKQWQKTIESIEQFNSNESNFKLAVDKEPTLRTVKASCYYFNKQTEMVF